MAEGSAGDTAALKNGPTFSNTPYRYQACRCEDPRGWLKEAQPRCGGGVGEGSGEAGGEGIGALLGVTPDLTRVQRGHRPLRRAGQAPGAEHAASGSAPRFGQVPDQPAGLRLFTVQIPHKRLRPAPALLPHSLGCLHFPLTPGPGPVAMRSSPALVSGMRQWWLGWV